MDILNKNQIENKIKCKEAALRLKNGSPKVREIVRAVSNCICTIEDL